jgi:glyoxylase-like metal-dependent hydrolase (beta-lactamase superfamily II)
VQRPSGRSGGGEAAAELDVHGPTDDRRQLLGQGVDHRALADVVAATGASVVAGAPDAEAITEQTGVTVDRPVEDGDEVAVGSCTLRVIRLTGHTPGSIALYADLGDDGRHLFTGDSLFPGGVGNTEKDPDTWVTGDEPMTGAQRSYLKTLSEEAKVEFDDTLSKAEASKRIDELQELTGRGKDTTAGR